MDRTKLLELLLADMAITKAIHQEIEAQLDADEAALWDGRQPAYTIHDQQRHDALAARLTQQNEQTIGGYYRAAGERT